MKLLDLAENFVLGSGTVTIDPDRKLMLLLYYRPKKELLLPKGRKDRGETLEAAAIRETFEESGYSCQLVNHKLATSAPDPSESFEYHQEPIACQQRIAYGKRKIILWYVAVSDSTVPWVADTQEEGEDFEPRWIPIHEALKGLEYDDDRKIATRAVEVFPHILDD
jgi:8-oxo-dGTP pyrophosphatase MutT (NUDIX family)